MTGFEDVMVVIFCGDGDNSDDHAEERFLRRLLLIW